MCEKRFFIVSNEKYFFFLLFYTLTLCGSMLKRNQLRDVALEWQTFMNLYELNNMLNMRLNIKSLTTKTGFEYPYFY